MKISTKGRYGLRILLDIALHQDSASPRMIRDIAASQQISEKYVGRLIIDLRQAGLVRSIRGAKGGFLLNRKPEEITLLTVIEAMEGPLAIVDCLLRPEDCTRHASCAARGVWDELNSDIQGLMNRVTLRRLMDIQQGTAAADYCI